MRRTVRSGALRAPLLVCALGLGFVGMGLGLARGERVDPLAIDLDCDAIRESRRALRKCLDRKTSLQLAAIEARLGTLDTELSPVERDLLRLRLAAGAPRISESVCHAIETDEGRRLCRRLEGRPHMHSVEQGWVLREEAKGARDKKSTRKSASKGRSDDR